MKQVTCIHIELLSDTCFSRGEGTAGAVDAEVEHDELGFPLVGGKTLRGLLQDSWLSMQGCFPELTKTAERVFGPEADLEERSILRIGDARVDEDTRRLLEAAETRKLNPLSPATVLEAFTAIRRQTSEERNTGAPAGTTLRSVRVVLRGLTLCAPLYWLTIPEPDDLRCLALAVLATRHGGMGRNRGRGHLLLTLDGDLDKTRKAAKGGIV